MKNYFPTRLFYFFVILILLLSAVGMPMQTVLAAPKNTALQLDGTNDHVTFGHNLDAPNFTPETLVNHGREGATMSTGTSGFDGEGGRPNRIYPVLAKGMGEGETPVNVNMKWFLGNTSTGVMSADFEDAVNGGNHPAWGSSANDFDGTGFMATQASTPTPTLTPTSVSGLLGHWSFDESSWAGDCLTKDILDLSGNGRHGTACINGDAPFPVPGKFGNAGRFDGIDQFVNLGPGFNFTSSFTAALWVALDDYDWCGPTGKSQHIIGTHHLATPTGNGRGWGIYWDCDGLAWELTNSTGNAIESYGFIAPAPFPANGSWHHVALVYDASVPSATLYWDGDPIYSESGIANVPSFLFNNGEPLTINGLPYAPSSGAPGKIDDTRVFNNALSVAEIQTLFDNQPPVALDDAYSTDQDTILNVTAPGVLGNDSDPNGNPIMAVKVSDPVYGTLSLNANGSFTYTPNPGFSGSDTFTYKASDNLLQSSVASVSILVNAIPVPTEPVIHYVKWNAVGAKDGTSWTDAFTDLQSALAAASSGDEIWMAAGTYKPTTGTDRTVSFALKNGVAVYGGFAGTETLLSQRNPVSNLTILSGDIGNPNDISDNSVHVVKGENLDNTAVLDGFTITAGNANGSSPFEIGGGMHNTNSHPTLHNLVFHGNLAGIGSAMFNSNSSPVLLNVTFSNNHGIAGSRGGAMVNDLNSSPSLTNVTFINNSVTFLGGAMLNSYSSNPSLVNVTFVGNSSTDRGGAIYNWESSPILKNVTIHGNSSGVGGAIYNDENSNPSIVNSILYGDTAGEIYNNSGMAVVTYSIVEGGYSGTGNLDIDPHLGPLQDNGGFSQTVALGASSPAIDAGDDANCPSNDQRGVARPQGSHCDIGAYEYEPHVPITLKVTKIADTSDGICDADCSLREAIAAALDNDKVEFDSSLSGQTITLTSILVIDKDLTIDGSMLPAQINISGNNSVQVFQVNSGVTATLDSLVIRNGYSTSSGGGIYNNGFLTVTNSTFNENHVNSNSVPTYGGAIANQGGTLIVTLSTFSANTVPFQTEGTGQGGAIYSYGGELTIVNSTFDNNSASAGGAIRCAGTLTALTVEISTFSFNDAVNGGALYNNCTSTIESSSFFNNTAIDNGGAILTDNDTNPTEVTNSTFYSNSASGAGGIANYGGLIVTNSTFSHNIVESDGVVRNGLGGVLSIRNSILANSIGGVDCIKSDGALEIESIHNLIESTGTELESCGSSLLVADPQLDALQNNGGSTQTMALQAGSPAINAGDSAFCPPVDQRGVSRPQGAGCDMGAFEFDTENIQVFMAGSLLDSYSVPDGVSLRESYALDNGPVKVASTDGSQIIAAMRAVWKVNGQFNSYSELIGLPKEQLSTEYYFPWYNNVTPLLDEQFRFGNVDTTATQVEVTIGSQVFGPYDLDPGESMRIAYPVDDGPVTVRSLDGKNIIAAMRAVWSKEGKYSSYSELMGLPKEQLSTEYYFPWYNNVTPLLDEQFRFGNVDTTATQVEVTIGNQVFGPYDLEPGESMRIAYPVDDGPVTVRSLDGKKIIAAMRAVWVNNGYSSYSELMGLPKEQLSTEYYFPWYNNATPLLDEQLRFGVP